MLQEPLQDKPCDCHDIPSNTAGARATRLDHKDLDEATKLQIQEFKVEIAKLYDKIVNLKYAPDFQGRMRLLKAPETTNSLDKALEQLQLASYYITHALTA